MTLCPDLAKYPPSLWRVRYPRLHGLDFNPWPMMPDWMRLATLVPRGFGIRGVHHHLACGSAELEEMLGLCGELTAVQTFARVQGDGWRRFAHRNYPFKGFHPKEQHEAAERAWNEQKRALRIVRTTARKLVLRAESRWRFYRIGFWLARKVNPCQRPEHQAITANLVELAWTPR